MTAERIFVTLVCLHPLWEQSISHPPNLDGNQSYLILMISRQFQFITTTPMCVGEQLVDV